jgi:hypothetical protein
LLAELGHYLIPRARPDIRRAGLLRQAVSLWSRSGRRKREWGAHYARCHAFIEAAISGDAPGRTVVVLGSGLVADIPLHHLATRFVRIVLVDAVHLAGVRWRLAADRRLAGKLTFDTRDLTGRLAHPDVRAAISPLADLHADPGIDLVISANCLSQLPRPIDVALTRRGLEDAAVERACRAVIDAHLADLAAFSCRTILLTDTAFSEIDAAGRVIERSDLLFGRVLPQPDAEWDWEVAPKGELRGGASFRHHVAAYEAFRAGATAPRNDPA